MSWIITGTEKYETDPYRSQVSLLLHGDGANGSTTITDSSPSPKTVTAFGDAQISTAQSKFGGSSIAFDGSADRITIASNSAFELGTGDFTVEAWVRETARAPYSSLLEIGNHVTSQGIIFLTNGGSNSSGNIGVYSGIFYGTQAAGSLDQWNHIAYVRSSDFLVCYVNGIGGTPVLFTRSLTDISTITIGSRAAGGSNYDFNGYIDDLRITKGVARYTSNFTPPTAPFPDI